MADALGLVTTVTGADMHTLALPMADAAVAEADNDTVQCKLCGTTCERSHLFAHVGAEVLDRELHPQSADGECHEYCGFCGATPPCAISIALKSGKKPGSYSFSRGGVTCLAAPLTPSYAWLSKATAISLLQRSPSLPTVCRGRTHSTSVLVLASCTLPCQACNKRTA